MVGFKRLYNSIGLIGLACSILTTNALAVKPLTVNIESGRQAKIMLIEGNVYRLDSQLAKRSSLNVGEPLRPGDIIGTDTNSRISIGLPDESILRFGEKTTAKIIAVRYDRQRKLRNININIVIGKAWAKVAKILQGKGRFELTTPTAVAGVRGTVYRLNAYADNSATVKVYEGEVAVSKQPYSVMAVAPQQVSPTTAISGPSAVAGPSTVSGPSTVAGPNAVSMQEWIHILKAMQQININQDGTATRPFAFDLKEDMNDWVRWNLDLDKIKQ